MNTTESAATSSPTVVMNKEQRDGKSEDIGPKYVNRGTYGCIYQPMIPCAKYRNTLNFPQNYISKISKRNESEERIGNIIKHIPHYQYYFAPIIDTCPVNIGNIDENEIKKCDIVKQLWSKTKEEDASATPKEFPKEELPAETPSDYESYKIRYVGENHLGTYIHVLERIRSTTQQWKQCIEIHIHALKALKMLGDAHLVHYDLKNNNIIMDDRYHVPILIDYGISFMTTDLDTFDYNTYKNIFYSDYAIYPPWCIEILLLSHILLNVPTTTSTAAEPSNKVFDQPITDGDMHTLEETYINYFTQNSMYTEAEATAVATKMKTLLAPYNGQPWTELIKRLIATVQSWDNYSLAIVMKEMINYLNKKQEIPPGLQEYTNMLTRIIVSDPDSRPTAEQTLSEIMDTFGSEATITKGSEATITKGSEATITKGSEAKIT
jgi:serine/threonine protein kinase